MNGVIFYKGNSDCGNSLLVIKSYGFDYLYMRPFFTLKSSMGMGYKTNRKYNTLKKVMM